MRYPESMITSLEPRVGSWLLLVGPSSLNTGLLQGIARLPVSGQPAPAGEYASVRVLDGGNRFNAYIVARAAHGRAEFSTTSPSHVPSPATRLLSLLESTPATPGPFVILDLLRTFYGRVQSGRRTQALAARLPHPPAPA